MVAHPLKRFCRTSIGHAVGESLVSFTGAVLATFDSERSPSSVQGLRMQFHQNEGSRKFVNLEPQGGAKENFLATDPRSLWRCEGLMSRLVRNLIRAMQGIHA